LRPIDTEVSGLLVDFVLHEIKGGDLDEGVEETGWLGADFETVPGMGAELAGPLIGLRWILHAELI
jgi:hypothetical protein